MGIKEIALRIGEEADEYADAKLQSKGEFHPDWHTVRDEYFAEALIESYKSELLKEVGEPVADVVKLFDHHGYFMHHTVRFADSYKPENGTKLYTSDQVAAAILKATGPLEEEMERLKTVPMKYRRMAFNAQLQDENNELRAQLAKAEQRVSEAWQPIETAPKDGTWFFGWRQYATRPRIIKFDSDYGEFIDEDGIHVYEVINWMPLPKAPSGASS